ncbi:alpha-2B adrenergic receptor-like [Clarias gariepinus]|uniref:alpha-2B adrenergic receptor-like n=1 Tax=Clarias gariepinus TaxID=13013 RepID=UPI00234D0898|nr:alpha-2B adrenergic receptor-like [Clarias gariepinus]
MSQLKPVTQSLTYKMNQLLYNRMTATLNQSTNSYSPEAKAAFATTVILMILFIIAGNLLVIIAVLTSRSLRGAQNLFLVSLAAADILVATLVMPFSLANELIDYWHIPPVVCKIFLALDVFLCTSSIIHLCAISLDRYLSVSHAVTYAVKRTPRHIKCAILVVWLISTVISLPPLFFMNINQGNSSSPFTARCELQDEAWYILFSCTGSFFAPCLIMIFVYMRIYQIAKQRTRCPSGNLRKEIPADATTTKGSIRYVTTRPFTHAMAQAEEKTHPGRTKALKFDLLPAKEMDPSTPNSPPDQSPCLSPFISCKQKQVPAPNKPKQAKKEKWYKFKPDKNNCQSSSSNSDMENEWENIQGSDTLGVDPNTGLHSQATIQNYNPISVRRKGMLIREKRFTFALSVVIGVFIFCWFPFFFSYSLKAICPDTCKLPEPVFTFFFWMGYFNSSLNPVIYTIFNKDFRSAIKKILCKNTKGTLF